MLNPLDPRACEWLVPGLLEEKIMRKTGLEAPRDAWNFDGLPPYLRLRFKVTDGRAVVADGCYLTCIEARLKGQVATAFQSHATSGFERDL